MDSTDPGFLNFFRPCRVLCDGVEMDHVETADEELGLIVRYVTHDGRLILDASGALVREELYGRVVIVCPTD